jgi:hypothetical protein
MNKQNLQRMADHIRTVPDYDFNMEVFRLWGNKSRKCTTVGCVIGHCTVLVPDNTLPRFSNGYIDFCQWSEEFTGLLYDDPEWHWCFSSVWGYVNHDNTPEGAALRIEWLINKGLPEDWEEQMIGKVPLCYLPNKTS